MTKDTESKMQYLLRLGIKISVIMEIIVLIIVAFILAQVGLPQPADIQKSGSSYFIWNTFYVMLGPFYNMMNLKIALYSFGGMLIAFQVYLYRKIGSSWNDMGLIKKFFLIIFVGIPAIYVGSFFVVAVAMIVIVIVIVILGIFALAAGGGNPSYSTPESEMTGLRNDIRDLKDEIKKL